MTNANKRHGTGFETDVVDYLRSRNQIASRIARTVPDEGDVVLGDAESGLFVLQLKANRDANTSASLGSRLNGAALQAAQYARARNLPEERSPVPVLVIKQPRKPIGKAFVVMYLEDFIDDREEDV